MVGVGAASHCKVTAVELVKVTAASRGSVARKIPTVELSGSKSTWA